MSGYPGVVLTDSPRGFWKLDEKTGLVFADSAGMGGPGGAFSGGVLLGEGSPFDDFSAAHFDGALGLATVSGFTMPKSFSLEQWFKSDTATWVVDKAMLSSGGAGAVNNGFITYCPVGTKTISFWIETSTAVPVNVGTYTLSELQVWTHLVETYNADTGAWQIIVNGVVGNSGTNLQTRTDGSSMSILLNNQAGTSRHFDGLMSMCAIYPYPLTAAQALSHYNARPASVLYRADDNTSIYTVVKT